MDNAIKEIMNEMAEYLSAEQQRKLQQVLLAKLSENRSYQKPATNEDYKQISRQYPVISTIPRGRNWEIQVVADEMVGYNNAEPFTPNLEHAYVYFMESKLDLWMND